MIPNPQPEYLYQDDEIKLEITGKSVISKTYVAVVKNYFVFEKEIAEWDSGILSGNKYYFIDDIKEITRKNKNDKNVITLVFDFGNEKIVKEIKTAHNKAYN